MGISDHEGAAPQDQAPRAFEGFASQHGREMSREGFDIDFEKPIFVIHPPKVDRIEDPDNLPAYELDLPSCGALLDVYRTRIKRERLSKEDRDARREAKAALKDKPIKEFEAIASRPGAMCAPIADTVAFAVPMSSKRLDRFFADNWVAVLCASERVDGKPQVQFEKYRAEHEKSWWGKMRMFRKFQKDEKGRNTRFENLYIEYSYHKWYGISNGLNKDLPNNFNAYWDPIDEALSCMGFSERERFYCRKSAILRRLDLSLNFRVDGISVTDYLKLAYRLVVQYQNEPSKNSRPGESVYWGTENSAFMVKMYDKLAEHKFLASKRDCPKQLKDFVKTNEDLLKNIVRFEVTFRPRFWQAKTMKNGELKNVHEDGINEIIDLSCAKWALLQERIRTSITSNSASFSDKLAFEKLQLAIEHSDYPKVVKNGISQLSIDCLRLGYKTVKSSGGYPPASFYRYKKILNEDFKWDIKTVSSALFDYSEEAKNQKALGVDQRIELCPIMYNMSTDKALITVADFYELREVV